MSRVLAILLPILILIVLGVGGAMLLRVLAPEPEEDTDPPPGLAVFAEPIEAGNLTLTVEAQGEVRPKRVIVVSPQISGRIEYVSPDFIGGGFIRKGQTLVRIERADYELAVTRARSAVASAEQRLARERAEAEIAREDLEKLGVEDASPLARREPQLAEARAALDSARAQLAEAELGLSRTTVTAPFTGRVRERTVDLGQFVSTGQELGRIFATDVVEVPMPITDDELGRVGLPVAFAATPDNPGPRVVFRGNVAGERRVWEGRITRTAASIDPRTRLIDVIGEVKDPYGEGADDGVPLAPGAFVDAEIIGPTIEDVLIAPRAALRGENEIYLGDTETGTLAIREVDVIHTDAKGAYLGKGVEAGELAIVSPVQAAFDGMRVKVLERRPDGEVIVHEPPAEAGDVSEETGPGEPGAQAAASRAQGGSR